MPTKLFEYKTFDTSTPTGQRLAERYQKRLYGLYDFVRVLPAGLTRVRIEGHAEQKKEEVIQLQNIDGITRLSGTDEHGNQWIQFEVDTLAEQEQGECVLCGATLDSGWMCLDGGEEVCDSHIEYEATA